MAFDELLKQIYVPDVFYHRYIIIPKLIDNEIANNVKKIDYKRQFNIVISQIEYNSSFDDNGGLLYSLINVQQAKRMLLNNYLIHNQHLQDFL